MALEEERKGEAEDLQRRVPRYILCVLPEEYIHWGGFVVSFLLVAIAMIFAHIDGVEQGQELSLMGYLDLILLFCSFVACMRYMYCWIRSWYASWFEDDDDDDDDSGNVPYNPNMTIRL